MTTNAGHRKIERERESAIFSQSDSLRTNTTNLRKSISRLMTKDPIFVQNRKRIL